MFIRSEPITMKKYIFIGIIAGILSKEFLFALLPSNSVYIDIFIGSLVAALISGGIASGIVVTIYTLAKKVAGLYFLADYYGTHAVGKHLQSFLFDYLIVLIIGIAGGWAGVSLNRYIKTRRQKRKKGTVLLNEKDDNAGEK